MQIYFIHVHICRWKDEHAKEVEMVGQAFRNVKKILEGPVLEEANPLTPEKVIVENLTELLMILSHKENWDLGAREEKR